ncbi:MAG: (2Fe-2S)-binding protein [Deltaproteobacteria bacterium]|nr:(2Fe-2S)-binding protein [Deltaproteobacteria bacterium]
MGASAQVDSRLTQHPGLTFQRGKEISLRFNGRPIRAYEGETIGAALHAAGIRILSRSVKYHRPRGLFCMAGNCPNCLLQVDGVPNVRACVEPVRAGMEVHTQVGWPSAQFDMLALLDSLGFLFPVGFPYRYFIRPRWLYHWWERLLRHVSGHGILPAIPRVQGGGRKIEAHTDIAVVGAGPAGLAAARAAAATGVQVALIDEGAHPGGSLRADTTRYAARQAYAGLRGSEIAERLTASLSAGPAVQVYANATAFGIYDGGVLGVRQGERLIKLSARRIIVATGAYENPLVADDWDRPGVFLATGAQRLLHLWGVRPGQAAVVISTNDFGLTVAAQLLEAGIEVRAVADSRVRVNETLAAVEPLREQGVPLLTRHTLTAARGRPYVQGATLARCDATGQPVGGTELHVPCDTIVLATGFSPANELVFHATYKGSYVLETAGTLTRVPYREEDMRAAEDLYVAGNAAGVGDLEKALLEGEIAGLSAALSLGVGGAEAEDRREQAKSALAATRGG